MGEDTVASESTEWHHLFAARIPGRHDPQDNGGHRDTFSAILMGKIMNQWISSGFGMPYFEPHFHGFQNRIGVIRTPSDPGACEYS